MDDAEWTPVKSTAPPAPAAVRKRKKAPQSDGAGPSRGRKKNGNASSSSHQLALRVEKDPEKVLRAVESLRKELITKDFGEGGTGDSRRLTLEDLNIPWAREVVDRTNDEVKEAIENFVMDALKQITGGEGFRFSLPQRSKGNERYVEELNRIVLGDKTTTREFASVTSVRKVAITARVLQLIQEICRKGIHVTKRDLFYTDVKLFKSQHESDVVIEDVACLLGCTRTSLNVVASQKGTVLGRLQFVEDGDPIDCSRMGVGGKGIPPFTDKITNIQSDAKFILIV